MNLHWVYDLEYYVHVFRGGPFDTQGGGGLCKFKKKLSGFHLLKK